MSDEQLAKKQFKEMRFKEKAGHIWYYYKIHIFIAVFLIISAVSVINAVFIHPSPKLFAGISFYNIHISDTFSAELQAELTEKVVPEEENKQVRCSAFYEVESDVTVKVETMQRFETLLMAKEIDLIVADEEDFKELVYQGYIINLDEYLDSDYIAAFDSENMLYKGSNKQDSSQKSYGICVKNSSKLLESKDINHTTTYVGIVRNNTHQEEAVKTLKELLK